MKRWMMIALQAGVTVILYILGACLIGLALWPVVHAMIHVWSLSQGYPVIVRSLVISMGVALGYFSFGLLLMLVIGVTHKIFGLKLREGTYKIGHVEMFKWFFVNALFLCVRTVFMDFMLLTPFCSFFYRLMGAKLGMGVQINSKNVADISLLDIGEGSVIGGNATVICHVFEPRGLTLKPVVIGKHVVIGLNAVIMPGCRIGDHSVIAAGAILPKNTTLAARTIYFSPERQVTHT